MTEISAMEVKQKRERIDEEEQEEEEVRKRTQRTLGNCILICAAKER